MFRYNIDNMSEDFDFSEALQLMKAGKSVCSKYLHTIGINWYKLDPENEHYIIISDVEHDFSYRVPDISVDEMLLEDWYEVKNNE